MPHIMNFGTLYDGKEESKGDEVQKTVNDYSDREYQDTS